MPQLDQTWVGSISEGTLRTQDLLPKFIRALEAADPKSEIVQEYAQIWDAARRLADFIGTGDYPGNAEDVLEVIGFWDSQGAQYMLNEELFDALNLVAPEGTSFGTSEGDGASFGFWPYEPDEEDDGEGTRATSDLSPEEALLKDIFDDN